MQKAASTAEPIDSSPHAGVTASPELQAHVIELDAAIGLKKTAEALGIGTEAVLRIKAGAGVRAGTLALAEQRMAPIRARGKRR